MTQSIAEGERGKWYTVDTMNQYEIFSFAGDPATLGRLQALVLRPQPPSEPVRRPPWADDPAFVKQCAAILQQIAPAVWEEIGAFAAAVGIAASAGLFLRTATMPHGCSAFAWRLADGHVIAGRNYDFMATFPNRHLIRSRSTCGYANLGMNGGMIAGRYDGVNEHGLFVALHKVMAQRPARINPGLPPHLIVRAALETCADAGEATQMIAAIPHLAAFNYTLADPAGRLITLECYPGLPVRIRHCARAVAVANHYVHPKRAPLQGRRPLAGSFARAEVMRRLPQLPPIPG
ncbi:MAG: hypothetical protein HC822_02385 [Oscillochloris sp.]|nr:hypothetical protein [Oscillochloris sp.]